ncbi:hypothetical protein ACFYXL_22950 [Streptomyces tsukubensis]|uniref:helix-turn-helix transcriptional regulator n=1 Tax=Streptomyces tsukubensis TaxID=83656 RepID=UPI0036BD3D41
MTQVLLITPGWDVREAPDELPASHVATGDWPDGALDQDAPPSAHIAQAITRRLKGAISSSEFDSERAVAEASGLTHPTVGRILAGEGLPDIRTLFLLEVGLQTDIWPAGFHEHYRIQLRHAGGPPTPDAFPPGHSPETPDRPATTRASREILRRMAAGQTHAEIAAALGTHTRTIGRRLAPVYEALGLEPGDTFRLGLWWATSDERLND